jgi:DNA-binding IclR family transcriptional regulator
MSYVCQNPQTKGYSLGVQVFRLGYAYSDRLNIVKIARPSLEALCAKMKETVHLARLLDTEIVYLDKIDGPMSISMRSRIGACKPAYCTGLGKILLAYQPAERLREIIDKIELRAYTHNTITNKEVLVRELAKCREQGYAIDDEEIEAGLVCAAAPVFDIRDSIVAAISVSGPKYRIWERLAWVSQEVVCKAKEISEKLGQRSSVQVGSG